MLPRMSDAERGLFESLVSNSDRYLEFGSGGSTYVACARAKSSVVSVDSSAEWQDSVKAKCLEGHLPIVPTLIRSDIGPIGEWGYPKDESAKERWPSYHTDVWRDADLSEADLYMVDGRFRVACFMQTILHCEYDSLIMIHDYASRKAYHVVGEVARLVATAEDLSVFLPCRVRSRKKAANILSEYAFTTA
jgi:hypothetical protein